MNIINYAWQIMLNIYSQYRLIHLLVAFVLLTICLSYTTNEKSAYAADTMLEFESNAVSGAFGSYLGSLDNCFTTGKVLYPWQYSTLNNTCLPSLLSSSVVKCNNTSQGTWVTIATIGRGIVYYQMMTFFPVGTVLAFLAIGIEYIIMVDICTNTYIVAPHEYINLENGTMTCQKKDGVYVNVAKGALTSTDVPFYYHCDPNWDPINGGKTLDPENPDDTVLIGKTWGYMGSASPYCVGDAANNAKKDMIGKVIVHYVSGWTRMWSGMSDPRCQKGGSGSPERQEITLDPTEDVYMMPAHYHAYYVFNSSIGKLQMCVAAPWTLLPVKVGCTYVPPPNDDVQIDQFILDYINGTRCSYFLTGRVDLQSLGKALSDPDENGHTGTPVKGFLVSDLHVVSTVVGCIQDILVKVFITPQETSTGKSFFQIIQSRMNDIVFVALVLYVTLIGMKLMTSHEIPKRSELIMYAVKFALVMYFALGDVWYEPSPAAPGGIGLYPSLINASSEIAQFFMAAQNDNDPIGLCRYRLQGIELLGNRVITSAGSGSITPTVGAQGVLMSIWDLIDCKVVNYINLGSCKYTITGMIGIWIISAAFFVGLQGFLLSIVSFIYSFMLLLIIFKFVHIFILSMFTITILVLLAPLFVSFALFEYTKGMFQKWMSMLLGYVIYPGLLFAFIALMLMTFDSVFFGDINMQGGTVSAQQACNGITSIYCATLGAVNNDPCAANVGNIGSQLTTTINLGPLGTFTILKDIFLQPYLDAVLKLMLFAFLFYMFMGSVSGFLAILTGVQDLGDMAKGSVDLAKLTSEIAQTVATKGANLAKKAGGAIKNSMSDAGKGNETAKRDGGGGGDKGGGGPDGDGGGLGGGIGGGGDDAKKAEMASKVAGAAGGGGAG